MSPRPGARAAVILASIILAGGRAPAGAADEHGRARIDPAKPVVEQMRERHARTSGRLAAVKTKHKSKDVDDVVVIVDDGLIVTGQNPFDLPASTTLRFEPSGPDGFAVSSSQMAMDPDFGAALAFGSPDCPFAGDDDTEEVAFPAGFPFLGATYASVFVNTDGNLTFGESDCLSAPRDKGRLALGPPRVAAFLHDFNPGGGGAVHAAIKSNPDRLVVTWDGVPDFTVGGASSFQVTLFSSGVITITLAQIDVIDGTIGIAQGHGDVPVTQVDLTADLPATLAAGVIVEAFAEFTQVSPQAAASAFYASHPDLYDLLVLFTDFPVNIGFRFDSARNDTRGIARPLFDDGASFGSSGELEGTVFMNNVSMFWPDAARIVDPPVMRFGPSTNTTVDDDQVGEPITPDGQAMAWVRTAGILPPDGGEWTRAFAHGGEYSLRLNSPMTLLSHEVEHRWGVHVAFLHPTKGFDFDSFDLLGRGGVHWSYFVNTTVDAKHFGGAPRSSSQEGNSIRDLGIRSSYENRPLSLDPGEHLFVTDEKELIDGYSDLDEYLMGLRRGDEVGGFFYVDEPKSIVTGEDLDPFDPSQPFSFAATATLRSWSPQGGIAFKGKRIDLTLESIKELEADAANPEGKRFWGPPGDLVLRYATRSRRVDPNGDATVTLAEADRELGDEADFIDRHGKPLDVKTMAFCLIVQSGAPEDHIEAARHVDRFRRAWQAYANGPATGRRGRFYTGLQPPQWKDSLN